MLLSAKFENIYSFNEETRILFTASKSDLLPLQVSRAEKRDDISVLRMGLIYGANASGKSNIIKCLAIIKAFALNGWSNRKYNYFKMTDNPQERSSIELEFKVDGQFLVSSLCEYKPRENVQKGYLNGRYGAIPFFGELDNIHWDDAK